MKIYGYSDDGLLVEEIRPRVLAEATLMADPDELRRIASFLLTQADAMERMGPEYSHAHLSDHQPGFLDSPSLVVFNPDPPPGG